MSGTATQITLSPSSIPENARRVTIGTLTANDPDPGDVLTFSVTDRRFAVVNGNELKTVSNFFDFERTPTYNLEVTVTDQAGNSYTQSVPITVLNVNEAPGFVSGPTTVTVRENTTAVATYRGVDPDAGSSLSYSIVGGSDAIFFQIDAATGALSFKQPRNFEVRADLNQDNIYNVIIGVSDGNLLGQQAVSVAVADVEEAGTSTSFRRRIDFAPEGSNLAEQFLPDYGAAYSASVGYGWITEASLLDAASGTIPAAINGIPGAVFERADATGTIDVRLRTVAQFEPENGPGGSAGRFAWEHAVSNGTYLVRVAVGDLGGMIDSTHVLNIEGVRVVDGFEPSATLKSVLVTAVIEVTDGRMTLDSIGGTNTEIQSIRFEKLVDQTPGDGRPVEADYGFFQPAVASSAGSAVEIDQQTGINPTASFRVDIGGADPSDPIDTSTISMRTVKLYEQLTGAVIPGTVNTDAAGGSINFTPTVPLKENTAYTLVIDGVQTVGNEELLVSTSTFATGLNPNATPTDVAFAREEMAVSASTPYSSLTLSPDGSHLYATTLAGTIVRWSVDERTGVLSNEQVLDLPELAGRALIGIAFDPENSDLLWITNNAAVPRRGDPAPDDFTSKITRLTIGEGAAFTATAEDYVVGLPRSIRDHLSNSLAFHQETPGGDWKLYMTQGSNSATGAPDDSWGNRPERLLTAAVLEIDPRQDVSGGPINVQTQDPAVVLPPGAGAQLGFYNPFAANAPVQIFASGVRNAYDLVWHSNGHLYVPTNGSAASGNTPDDPNTPQNEALISVGAQNDYLFDVREGFYYGHPNPVRGEYILSGGNPTAGDDGPDEIASDDRYPGYPVGVGPDGQYGGFAYNFSVGRSPNGALEYLSNAFGGALQNALLVVEYSGGKDIVAIRFDADGNVIEGDDGPFVLGDARGAALRFANPLDLATDVDTGRVYVLQLSSETGGAITLLTPTAKDPNPPAPRILEAEDAVIGGGAIRVATSGGGFSDDGYVKYSFNPRAGETITWSFNVAEAGIYEVGFRYSLQQNAATEGGRPLTLSVNGGIDATLPFLPSGATVRDWITVTQQVEFHVGENQIVLTSIGNGGPNIDFLQIPFDPLTAINTRPTVSGAQADVSFLVGQPVSFVLDGISGQDVDQGDTAELVARLVGGGALPPWLDFDPGTNQFSSNQSAVPAPGIYEIEIVARDIALAQSLGRVVFSLEILRDINPADIDGDGVANAADADDDADGVADVNDPFAGDRFNGGNTLITEGRKMVFDFEDRPFGAAPGYALGADPGDALGITGLHLSGNRTPEQLGLGSPNLTIGGGVLHIENAGQGDLATGDLTLGAQFGIDPIARLIRISATFDHPFDTRAPARGANFGLLIGTGDADSYVKFVLEGLTTTGAFLQMETRLDGVRDAAKSPSFGRTNSTLYRQADGDDTVTFTFDLDTVAGTLTASWAIRNGADLISGTAPTITLTGELLDAIRGDHTITTGGGVEIDSGLSVGIVASSRKTTPPLDIDVLDITVEGLVTDPDIVLVSGDSPLLGSRAVFSFIRNPAENTGPPGANPPREFKDTAVITVRNDGNDTLHVTGLDLDGPFRLLDASDSAAFTLLIGQSRDIEIGFDSRPTVYDPEEDPELFKGTLEVFSDDPDAPIAVADLAGFFQSVPEGGQEPNFNELMEVFGFGTRADQDKFDNFDFYRKAGSDEILSPYWTIAEGYDAVTVTQLAAYHDISNAAIFLYEPGNDVNEESIGILTHDNVYNQTLLPLRTNGTAPTVTFDGTTIPDSWIEDEVFGFRVAGQFSDPRLNQDGPGNPGTSEQRGHFIRFYVAKDEDGNVIEDTYLIAQDYQGINYDYQDNLYLVRGITPLEALGIG